MAKSKPPAPQVPSPIPPAVVADVGPPSALEQEAEQAVRERLPAELAATIGLPEPMAAVLKTGAASTVASQPQAPIVGQDVLVYGFDPDNTHAEAAPFPAKIVRVVSTTVTPPVIDVYILAAPAKINGANNTGHEGKIKLYPAGEGPTSERRAEWMPTGPWSAAALQHLTDATAK